MVGVIVFLFLIILIVIVIIKGIRIVPQQTVAIVERVGKFYKTLHAGINIIIPIIDNVRSRHDLRIQQEKVPSQSVITKDNVAIGVELATFFSVVDPKLATYGIANYVQGIHNIVASALRSTIGKMELDEILSNRDRIQAELRQALDNASENWGVRIDRVEILQLEIPIDIQTSMEKQMRAEREKRANILQAEGEKQATVLRAEAQQSAVILAAEAEKRRQILDAEAKQKSQELEALGRAEAIKLVANAERSRIEALNEAGLNSEILTYKSFEALSEMARGEASTIFIPTDIVSTLGSVGTIAKVFNLDKNSDK
ncbi:MULTISPECIES: stomatin-like protein [Paenibacillus]|uniref:Stomatin-like protein n=1 Tax=Paenibacillus violae TaxID=3077234 RepID=A0ABU3RD77_9BACL|nr:MULTISPECIES: stomatin-like protein [Paenibacillus]MDU0202023.1 stomatin-like protein [Paenibacillus sp. PFR10]MEC0266783.1 paraslipin [Paenibacillus anseongense]